MNKLLFLVISVTQMFFSKRDTVYDKWPDWATYAVDIIHVVTIFGFKFSYVDVQYLDDDNVVDKVIDKNVKLSHEISSLFSIVIYVRRKDVRLMIEAVTVNNSGSPEISELQRLIVRT